MNNAEIIKEIKALADKLGKIAGRGVERGGLSGLETEIIIDSLKAIYDRAIDLAEADIPDDEPAAAHEAESLLESILGDREEEPARQEKEARQEAPEETVVETTVETKTVTTIFTPPIDPAVINSLYGDAEEDAPQDGDKAEDEEAPADETVITVNEISRETVIFNETMGGAKNLADKISSGAVDSLRTSIGINDKFLLVRDLFGGDAGRYDEAIDRLDGFADADDAFIYLHENFAVDPDSEGVKLLVSLLERKNG